jgi:CRISPR/Cas system CSM-associated protein Csm5 (group 7 of RAMP superfamily)
MELKIEVLSPVNIGSGEVLSQFSDYVYDEGFVYILDHDALIQEIIRGKNGEAILDEFVNIVQSQAKGNTKDRFRLKGFLTEAGVDFRKFALRKIAVQEEIQEEIQLHVKSAGQPIIPGSSLKGAIRTALIVYLFAGDERRIQNKKKYIGEDIFGRYGDDVLKYLHVSDTLPFRQEDLGIVKFSNFHLKNKKSDIPIVKEALMRGSVSYFKIKTTALQGEVKEKFAFLNCGQELSILPIVNEFTCKNIKTELEHLGRYNNAVINSIKDFYSSLLQVVEQADTTKEAYLRIGSGKTFYDNTIAQRLSDNFLRRLISKSYKKADPDTFPVTRTIVQGMYGVEVPGWIKISQL